MTMTQAPDQLTAAQIAEQIGAKETTVKKAIDDLGIQGSRAWSDRRKIIYPADTLERVKQWLIQHS